MEIFGVQVQHTIKVDGLRVSHPIGTNSCANPTQHVDAYVSGSSVSNAYGMDRGNMAYMHAEISQRRDPQTSPPKNN